MTNRLHVLAIAGSLRKRSLNRAILRAAVELAPPSLSIELEELGPLPMYDGDLDLDGGPPTVRAFKDRIAASDGLLIATPEYNYGIPGVLKNALDWASRPAYRSVLAHKPVAILGVASGLVGTARAQGQLKQVLLGTISQVFPYPELLIGSAAERFDEEGRLVDAGTRESLARMLDTYAAWLSRWRAGRS